MIHKTLIAVCLLLALVTLMVGGLSFRSETGKTGQGRLLSRPAPEKDGRRMRRPCVSTAGGSRTGEDGITDPAPCSRRRGMMTAESQ